MPAEGLKTSRAALGAIANAAGVSALAILPAIAAAAPAPGSSPHAELSAMIEAHRAAFLALDKVYDRVEFSYPDGETLVPSLGGVWYSVGLSLDEIREHIETDFARELGNIETISKMSPPVGSDARSLLEAKRAACLAPLEEIFAEHSAAVSAWKVAQPAEENATMAICAYRCVTIDEAAIKAKYLAHREAIQESLTDVHWSALLRSFLPSEA
jgi:hypothetical protein